MGSPFRNDLFSWWVFLDSSWGFPNVPTLGYNNVPIGIRISRYHWDDKIKTGMAIGRWRYPVPGTGSAWLAVKSPEIGMKKWDTNLWLVVWLPFFEFSH